MDDTTNPIYQITDTERDGSLVHASYMSLISEPSSDTFSEDETTNYSMSTLESHEVADYFRLVHGFTYLSDENVPLAFPADTTYERLDVIFHTIVRLCQGGMNVPEEADRLLRSGGVEGAGEVKVLDIVTNSGSWVNEMSTAYPTVSFVSLDTKPLVPHQPHERITFEVYEFYAGIMESDSSFDLVHVRLGVFMTKDFNTLIREMYRVLKPNGMLLITELPVQPYEGHDPTTLLHSAPRHADGVRLIRQAWELHGMDIAAWNNMAERLQSDHPLWDETPIKESSPQTLSGMYQESARGFYDINLRTGLVPSGPWPEDETAKVVGTLGRVLGNYSWKSLLPMLLMMGVEESQAHLIVNGVIEEFADDCYPSYLKCHMWSAKRI